MGRDGSDAVERDTMKPTPTGLAPNRARRALLTALGVVGATAAAGARALAAPISPSRARVDLRGRPLTVVDLTHELTSAFNFAGPRPRIAMQAVDGSGVAVGMNMNLLSLVEHTGTHLDVPRHFAKDGASLGQIPIGDLVVPLAVIDVRSKASKDRNAALEPADILAWERRHGRLPAGCCVAMHAGWDFLASRAAAAQLPASEQNRSPGFSPEAGEFLMNERQVKGIAVEGGSIDTGTNGPAYPLHQSWLRSGRWGIEGMTNLDQVPPSGALLVVGAAPIRDATGMPVRVLAIF